MIEFGQLMSDMPSFQNRGSMKVDNVIPLPKGYKSFPSFAELTTTALTGSACGLHTQLSGSGTTNYCGDATKLYQMDSSLIFQDKSKATGYSNSTTENSRDFWAFSQYGNRVIATNYADNVQSFVEGTSTAFADLVSDIKAKYVSIIREFVFLGFVKEYETAKTFDSNTISSNQITISSHGFSTGDTVVYDRNSNTALTNLTDGSTYYVISVNSNAIKLSTTSANSLAGTAITLSATGGSQTHKVQKFIENQRRVKWSGINDPTTFTVSQTTMSDYQDLPDTGSIMGIVGGESFGVIFTERAIWRCDFVGTPLIFQFSKVADNIGAFAPRSIASIGSDIYFLAQDGFYKISNGSQITPIGKGKIDEYFLTDLSANFEGICSAIDINNSLYVISYRGANSTGGSTINNKLLVYNYATDAWSTCSGQALEFIGTASQEAFTTLESLDVLGSVDDLPKTLDSYFYGEGILGLAGFSSAHKFGKFLGGSMTATVDTTEFEGAEGKRSTLINARPIVDANGENTTITVTPITRSSQADKVTTGSAVTVKSSGDCPLRTNSRYHRLRVIVNGNFTNMQGVDVDARPEGKR